MNKTSGFKLGFLKRIFRICLRRDATLDGPHGHLTEVWPSWTRALTTPEGTMGSLGFSLSCLLVKVVVPYGSCLTSKILFPPHCAIDYCTIDIELLLDVLYDLDCEPMQHGNTSHQVYRLLLHRPRLTVSLLLEGISDQLKEPKKGA